VKFLLDHDVPDSLSYLLRELGHDVSLLREVIPTDAQDSTVLQFANDNQAVLVTCNRDDFVELANRQAHHGIVIVIRRKTRAAERAALFRLLQRAGEPGLLHNVNIA
jgi:predicted nuclease of predicted toxin-antitoxin system